MFRPIGACSGIGEPDCGDERRMAMRRLLTAVVAAGLLAGCSSSSAPRASQASTTSRARPARAIGASTPSPRESAVALSHQLLDEAVLPPGARRTDAPLPRML